MYSFPQSAAMGSRHTAAIGLTTVFAPVIGGLYATVTGLTALLTPLLGPLSAAAAIVLLTMGVRLLLHPLARRQVAAERRRRELAPRLRELQRRHRRNPERLRREMAAFYKRERTSPLAGIGPALAQAPIFIAMYALFLSADVGGHANDLLNHTLVSVPLGAGVFDVSGASLVVFAALFALLALVALATSRLASRHATPDAPAARLIRVLPYGTVAVAAFVPLAAGLYLLTTTAWTLAERILLLR